MADAMKIVLAGEGGQGVQVVANIMTEAAYNEGKQALYIPNFGVEQRGGVSVAFVQIADGEIASLKFPKADIVVALSPRAVLRTAQYVDSRTTFVYDTSIDKQLVAEHIVGAAKVLAVPAMEMVKQKYHPRVFNVLVMGVAVAAAGLNMSAVAEALVAKLQYKFDKEPELKKMNLEVLELGGQLVAQSA